MNRRMMRAHPEAGATFVQSFKCVPDACLTRSCRNWWPQNALACYFRHLTAPRISHSSRPHARRRSPAETTASRRRSATPRPRARSRSSSSSRRCPGTSACCALFSLRFSPPHNMRPSANMFSLLTEPDAATSALRLTTPARRKEEVLVEDPVWLVWKLEARTIACCVARSLTRQTPYVHLTHAAAIPHSLNVQGTRNLANVINSKEFPYDMEVPILGVRAIHPHHRGGSPNLAAGLLTSGRPRAHR